MSEWYGSKLILSQPVEPIEPFPDYAQQFFKIYANILKEVYNGKREMDSEGD